MAAVLLLASVFLAPAAVLDPPSAMPSTAAIVALVTLGVLCTAAAMVCYGVLIAEVGASRGLVITYINPVVAVTLGVILLGERPGMGMVAGLPLILLGSWLSTDGRLTFVTALLRRRRALPPPPGLVDPIPVPPNPGE
jgi:drug/metabolite transporter (DMT)-like permease